MPKIQRLDPAIQILEIIKKNIHGISLESNLMQRCTFTIPGGMPASSARTHRARAVNGVSSDGFRITEHPAARAGASFRHITISFRIISIKV